MSVLKLMFGFRGRATRAQFWLAALVWVVAIPASYMFAGGVMQGLRLQPTYGLILLLLAVGLIPTLVSIAAVGSRRLHDRGKSGLWILVFVLAPNLVPPLLIGILPMGENPSDTALAICLVVTTVPFLAWGLIELGLLPGTPGPNRFGEPPASMQPA